MTSEGGEQPSAGGAASRATTARIGEPAGRTAGVGAESGENGADRWSRRVDPLGGGDHRRVDEPDPRVPVGLHQVGRAGKVFLGHQGLQDELTVGDGSDKGEATHPGNQIVATRGEESRRAFGWPGATLEEWP